MTLNQTSRSDSDLVNRRDEELRRMIEPETEEAESESSDWFENLAEFVCWAQTITTKPVGVPMSWCVHWDQHSREKEVLAALWGAYEKVKQNPTEYLGWLHYHFIPLIEEMIQPNGPLSSCRSGHQTPIELGPI